MTPRIGFTLDSGAVSGNQCAAGNSDATTACNRTPGRSCRRHRTGSRPAVRLWRSGSRRCTSGPRKIRTYTCLSW